MAARLRTTPPKLAAGFALSFLIACSGGGRKSDGPVDDGLQGDSGAGDGDVGDGGDDDTITPLVITPEMPTLQVSGTAATIQLTATLGGLPLQAVTWSSDNTRLGYVDGQGVFHSSGLVAGTTTVTARFRGEGGLVHEGTTVLRVISNVERTQDGVTPEQKTAIETGTPTADATFVWLYPYDKTVFPRGLPGPFLQFGGGAADALRIVAKVGDFTFKGFYAAKNPASIELPAEIWDAVTNSSDGTMEVTVEVTKLVGANVVGPTAQTWRIAAGDLKGIIYYNTYNSPLANNNGAVMRIRPGEQAEVMIGRNGEGIEGGCTVCHSVSAQGNVLAAGREWGDGNPRDSKTFDLLDDGTTPERGTNSEGRMFPFAALTPDGTMLVNNGVPKSGSPIRGLDGEYVTQLFDSKTTQVIAAPSLTDQVKYALTPVFSPDAKFFAYSSFDGEDKARKLKVMDVDMAAQPPLFGTPRDVATTDTGIVGWPSFFPDGKGLMFHQGERFDTNTHGGGQSHAELRLADTATNTVNPLATLNGWLNQTDTYLPYPNQVRDDKPDPETGLNYEPSVLPVPVGGYYWVLFTSRRAYGHTLAPGGTVAGSDNKWGSLVDDNEVPSPRKKLWVAAIDLDYSGKADPSHPAFYLPGQELEAGNMRAYATLAPCKQEGDTCSSGADCCEGFCRQIDASGEFGEVQYTCVPPVAGCSNIDETCTTSADCCGYESGDTCINNRCAAPFIDLQ
jgi:hypothetical protein